jgi:hypothetical protein
LVILLGLLTFSIASYVGVKYFKEKKAAKVSYQKSLSQSHFGKNS